MKHYMIDIRNAKDYTASGFAEKTGKLGATELNKFMELKTILPGFSFEEKKLDFKKCLTNEMMDIQLNKLLMLF